jgi:hypothetical protein
MDRAALAELVKLSCLSILLTSTQMTSLARKYFCQSLFDMIMSQFSAGWQSVLVYQALFHVLVYLIQLVRLVQLPVQLASQQD